MIVLVTKDLFFVPQLRAAVEAGGSELCVALSADAAKLEEIAAEQVTAWILDLTGVALANLPATVELLQRRFPTAIAVAFGPHVQTERLQAARQAGCQHVLSRGQLDGQLERWLPEWL